MGYAYGRVRGRYSPPLRGVCTRTTKLRRRGKVMSETMQEMMAREQAEALATLMKANRALERIFGIEEGEEDE